MQLQAQKENVDSTYACGFFHVHYGYTSPGADMAKRFGANSNVGFGISFKTDKNWVWGADFDYLFGNKVKEDDILKYISTKDGFVIDANGTYADIFLFERGFQVSGKVGKIIPVNYRYQNSGILLSAGAGYLMHKIRIENTGNTAPQVKNDYNKGYDRLSAGISMNQFAGFIYFGESKLFNFYAGLEFTEAFTKSLRTFNFDTRQRDTDTRFEFLWGARVGWVIPYHKRSSQMFYYY